MPGENRVEEACSSREVGTAEEGLYRGSLLILSKEKLTGVVEDAVEVVEDMARRHTRRSFIFFYGVPPLGM
jgi:hypothetical protein